MIIDLGARQSRNATQSRQRLAFLKLIQASLPELSPNIRKQWMNNPDKLKEYLAGLQTGCATTAQSGERAQVQPDGVIYLQVQSSERNGRRWAHRLETKGIELDLTARRYLLGHKDITPPFSPIGKGEKYTIALVPAHFFPQKKRTARQLFGCLKDVKLTTLPPEACLHVADFFAQKLRNPDSDIDISISCVMDSFTNTLVRESYILSYSFLDLLNKSMVEVEPSEFLRKGKLNKRHYIAFCVQD